jgi:beta-barrel assembly-enhancing protease
MNALYKGLILLTSFLGVFFLLAQIDFIKIFKIEETKSNTETKIGNAIWDNIKMSEELIVNDSITKTLDKLLKNICDKNDIERDSLKVHLIKKDEVNAFALPNKHLVVFSGLIQDTKNQSALVGVLGHEIAHIENNHVMKKLSREIGFSVLISLTTGGKDPGAVKQILKTLTSSAYDRDLEKEADLASVEYMIKADVNPTPFADFLYQMAMSDSELSASLAWLNSHPESEERSKYILEFIKGKKLKNKEVLSAKEWETFKSKVTAQ